MAIRSRKMLIGLQQAIENAVNAYQTRKENGGHSGMTSKEFKHWMRKHGYSIAGLAETLGISPRQVSYYRSGGKPVDRIVELALRGLSA